MRFWFAPLLAFLLIVAPANAQFMGGIVPIVPAPSQLWTLDTVNESDEAPVYKRQNTKTPVVRKAAPKPQPAVTYKTSFKPSPARRKANTRKFIDRLKTAAPAEAAKIEAELGSANIFAAIQSGIAGHGLSINDIADAYAVWWINMWEASQGIVGQVTTRETAMAVKAQVASGFRGWPQLGQMTDAQKQDLSDELFLIAATATGGAESLTGKPGEMKKYGVLVRNAARQSGVDLDSFQLTSKGFVLR